MIVEDEALIAMDLKATLERLGFTVAAQAVSTSDAIAKARDTPLDLVLMDIHLENGSDGIEAAESLRSRHIPVVFLTSYADEDTLRRATRAEPFGYVVKPYHAAELNACIEVALYKDAIEKRLLAREEWLSNAMRSLDDGVIASDTKGHVVFMNPAAERLTGWNQENTVNKPVEQVFNVLQNPIRKVLQNGVACRMPAQLMASREGSSVVIDDSAAAIRDHTGHMTGAVVAFREVTERLETEVALKKSNVLLEKRLKEQSAELLAARQESESFCQSVAHDLRGPLTVIDGSAKMLFDTPPLPSTESRAFLTDICRSTHRMVQLIEGLLSFSRLGKVSFTPYPIDMNQLVSTAIMDLCALNPEQAAIIQVQKLPAAHGDGTLIGQVWTNLISNALKFSSAGPMPAIIVGSYDDNNTTVYFVKDNGVGFDPEHTEKLFKVFSRLHSASNFEGIGIGLSLAARIVHRHGGTMWAKGAVNQGATFYFTLGPAS